MEYLGTKTVLVYDRGSFMKVAERLARDFKHVLYYNPIWKQCYPRFTDAQIGAGLLEAEGVERIEHLWDYIDEIDLFYFPDTLDSDLQVFLRDTLGKRVWGSGRSEMLELNRVEALEYLKDDLGLPVPKYVEVSGLDDLREYLKKHKDVYVKTDTFRGTFETFHSDNYDLIEPLLDKLESDLGPAKNIMEFSVFSPIEGIELAYDGFCIDGQWPKKSLFGYEVKDMGYCGHVKPFKALYKEVRLLNETLSETLKINKYRNFISPEMRIDSKGVGYMTDLCARHPSPVSEVYYELITNFSEVVWNGAAGVLVEPIFAAEYAMTLVITSDWAMEHWQAVHFPKEISKYVKLRNYTVIDGVYYVIPNTIDKNEVIGVVVAIGKSLEDCAAKINGYADQVKGYRVNVTCATVDKMQKEIDKGEKIGVHFD